MSGIKEKSRVNSIDDNVSKWDNDDFLFYFSFLQTYLDAKTAAKRKNAGLSEKTEATSNSKLRRNK